MEYEIRPKEKTNIGLQELWQYRELFYFFTWRDIRVKYKQTFFGFAWAILQPVLLMILFTLIFGDGQKTENVPYPVFAFTGLIVWTIFSSGLSNSGNSMVSNANIIKKIYFPRLIIPISAVLVALFDFLMTLPVLIALLLWYHVAPALQDVWMLPAGLLLALVSTLGPGCLLAALNVKFRDFRYIIPFLVQFLLFATPVIYPQHYFPQRWLQELFALNPMSGAVSLFRGFFTGQQIDVTLCLISCVSAIVFFFLGLFVFRKTESYFADLA
jgi:lipopolysaccharide transport system permease protein